ncbi:hypothetical protein CEW89_06240 [Celeribacter ethanolicus]|uniref:DUF2238 domain-containing protein n=2 Tax=Celeribacter ethanolicus TaxID=1758178 RepID=A0A291GHR4_9RHOB|nr:hypothetical protein CEW89_06240 [Celeribacter ethanolicus]
MAMGPVTRAEKQVGLFTALYVIGFTLWFFAIGNFEFVIYVVTMLILIGLVATSLRKVEYPPKLLWALTLWGLLHMAGGGVPVNGSVLYTLELIPFVSDGEMTILKYDQVVHFYGFGVTAWLLWQIMTHTFPVLKGTKTAFALPALGAMGLGAVNEIIEFSAVLMVPDTNVGGYINTALDLVFNAAGALFAMGLVTRFNGADDGKKAP